MEIVGVGLNDAEVVGLAHSAAWKQAYENVFPMEYLYLDTPAGNSNCCIAANYSKIINYLV